MNGIIRNEHTINHKEKLVKVNSGSIMLMKPLLFHKSYKTKNKKQRRVIHLELSNAELPNGLEWAEAIKVPLVNQKSKIINLKLPTTCTFFDFYITKLEY